MTETYECMNEQCKFIWKSTPGLEGPCRICGSKYMTWVNFEEDWEYSHEKKCYIRKN